MGKKGKKKQDSQGEGGPGPSQPQQQQQQQPRQQQQQQQPRQQQQQQQPRQQEQQQQPRQQQQREQQPREFQQQQQQQPRQQQQRDQQPRQQQQREQQQPRQQQQREQQPREFQQQQQQQPRQQQQREQQPRQQQQRDQQQAWPQPQQGRPQQQQQQAWPQQQQQGRPHQQQQQQAWPQQQQQAWPQQQQQAWPQQQQQGRPQQQQQGRPQQQQQGRPQQQQHEQQGRRQQQQQHEQQGRRQQQQPRQGYQEQYQQRTSKDEDSPESPEVRSPIPVSISSSTSSSERSFSSESRQHGGSAVGTPRGSHEASPSEKGDSRASVEKITKGVADMDVAMMPRRVAPGRPGKQGRGMKILLSTNHLALSIRDSRATVYHYDVTVTPERPLKFYRPALEQMRRQFYPDQHPAFDGRKNLYSYKKLPIQRDVLASTVMVYDQEKDKDKEMEVEIKYANAVNFSKIGEYLNQGTSINTPQEAIQALDIVLRNPAANRFTTVGRSFFSPPPGQIVQLGGGLDLWYGFYQSAIIGWKPFLNIDVAHKGFPSAQNCIDILCDIARSSRERLDNDITRDRRAVDNFKSFIKTLRIAYEVPRGGTVQKRTYRVNDLAPPPRFNKFKTDKGIVTVENYFRDEYKYQIKFPNVPCLECGSKEKPISLPTELCRVLEGQVVNRKLNELQTRNMVKAAAVSTDRRRDKIENSIRQVNYNDDPCLKEFGLTVATQFTEVEARILDPPKLLYNQRQQNVMKGVWRSDRFLSTLPLTKWGILCAEQRTHQRVLDDLAESLKREGSKLGMSIQSPVIFLGDHQRDVERCFSDWKKDSFQLAIVILPERGITYARIKQIAERQVGLLTQCLKSKTLQRLSPATVVNILLKINSKHNGINHNVTCAVWEKYFSRPVIVFGADVTHPAPGQMGVPSVAAVAASYEPKAFSYNMEWRFQPPREEMICDLENIVKKQLMAFYKHNKGMKPEHIFFYRDGVSEGQFKKVLEIELQAIRRACRGLGPTYEPPITFLVVQKRHHTRFFPKSQNSFDGSRNNNVPAGTVVDTVITHKQEIDFYLVSHASIQGTSRPTKYHVLWDDANMSEDDIEEITYYLCHLFTRCTRAVSYPAPTYYAHLAAFRIRSYEDQDINLGDLGREEMMKSPLKEFVQNSPMYYI